LERQTKEKVLNSSAIAVMGKFVVAMLVEIRKNYSNHSFRVVVAAAVAAVVQVVAAEPTAVGIVHQIENGKPDCVVIAQDRTPRTDRSRRHFEQMQSQWFDLSGNLSNRR
jgi:hypothetical protein